MTLKAVRTRNQTLETRSHWLLLMRAGWLAAAADGGCGQWKLLMVSGTPRYRSIEAEVGRKVSYCVLTMLTLRRESNTNTTHELA